MAAQQLSFKYDREGDILYIDKVPPYAEQETEELGDDVIARLNPTTGERESRSVLLFYPPIPQRSIFLARDGGLAYGWGKGESVETMRG